MSSRISVLHVDDDPAIGELTTIFLERANSRFAVTHCSTPEHSLDYISGSPPDCVVSDYDMPTLDGLDLLRTVRERNPDLPFILYTGKGTEEVAAAAIDAGITDYMRKEIGTKQYTVLATRIRNAVETTRMDREISRIRARYTALAEQSLVGVISIVDGRIAFVNDRFADVVNKPVTDLRGSPVNDSIGPSEVIESIESVTVGESVSFPITIHRTDDSSVNAVLDGRGVPGESATAFLGVVLPEG